MPSICASAKRLLRRGYEWPPTAKIPLKPVCTWSSNSICVEQDAQIRRADANPGYAPGTERVPPAIAGLVGADGSYLGGTYATAVPASGDAKAVVYPQAVALSYPAAYQPPTAVAMPQLREHEPEPMHEDVDCAFWSMVFSWICCVGCISFCVNCSAPAGSRRLKYARIGCVVSCVVGEC